MMKKFYNIIYSFVLIILLVINLTGCSKQAETKKSKVIFWHSFVATTIPALNELIDRFEKEHPDIEIDAQYVPTGDALVQKLITAI